MINRKYFPFRVHQLLKQCAGLLLKPVAHLTVIAVLLLAQGTAGATSDPVRSASEIEYPPFCIVEPDGNVTGFSNELLREALAAMDREVTFRTGTWPEVRQWLARGEVEALPLVGRTPEREHIFDFTFAYMSLHGAIVVRDTTTGITDLSDLRGKTVGVMEGDNAEEFLRREDRSITIQTTPTFRSALWDLSAGQYDAVVIQRLVGLRLMQELGLPNLRIVNKPLYGFRQDFCFAVKEGDRETLALLNEGLSLVMADGTYRRLHSKWFATLQLPGDRPIVVGGDHNFPPFEYLDEHGRPTGFNVELTRAIAREMDLDITIRLGPWAEIRQALADGEIDVIQGMFYSEEREKTFDFTPAHSVNHQVSVVRKGEGPAPETIDDLADKQIVVQRGDIMHDFVLERNLRDQVTAVESQEEALSRLAHGEFDCALGSRLTALYWIDKNGWTNLTVGRESFISPENAYAVKNNQALLTEFSEGLQVLKNSGELHDLNEKWYGVYEPPDHSITQILRMAAFIIVPLLLIAGLAFLWAWSLRKQVARRTEELWKSEESLRVAARNLQGIIYILDTELRFTLSKGQKLDVLGLRQDEAVGQTIYEFYDTDDPDHPMIKHHRRALEGEEITLESTHGDTTFSITISPMRTADGTIVGIVGLALDITGRKQAEEALQKSEIQFRRFFETAQDGMLILDATSGEIMDANSFIQELLGYTKAELVGKRLWEIGTFHDIAANKERFTILREQGVVRYDHLPLQTKEGKEAHVEFLSNTYLVGEQEIIQCNIRDISDRVSAEKQVRQEQQLIRQLFQAIPDTIYFKDREHRFVRVNPAKANEQNTTPEEMIGKTDFEYFPKEIAEQSMADDGDVLKTGEPIIELEEYIETDAGKGQWVLVTKLPRYNATGEIIGTMGLSRDITDRKEVEEALRHAKEKAERYLNIAAEIIVSLDTEGNITLLNQSGHALLGYEQGSLIGENWFETCIPETVREEVRSTFQRLMQGENPSVTTLENPIVTASGEERIFLWHNTILTDDTGEITGTLSSGEDITEKKHAEQRLQQERAFLEQLAETSPVGITKVDRTGQIVFANQRAEGILGLTTTEIQQRTYNAPEWEITTLDEEPFPEEDLPFVQVKRTEASVYDVQHAIIWPDGTRKFLSINAAPVFDESGVFDGMVSTIQDITELKRTEEERQKAEGLLRMLANHISDSIFFKDAEHQFIYVNPKKAEEQGTTPDEMIGKTDFDYFPEPIAREFYQDDVQVFESGKPIMNKEERIVTGDGDVRWVIVEKHPRYDQAGNIAGTMGIARDITDRKRAEEALRDREEHLRTTLNSIGDAVIATDLKGKVVRINPVAESLTGWNSEDAEGRPLSNVFNIVYNQTRKPVENPVSKVLKSGEIVGLANHTVLISRDGAEYQIADSAAPIRNDTGKVRGVVLVFRDQTAEYEARQQLEASEQQYRSLFNSIRDALLVANSDREIIDCNQAFTDLFGYTLDEIQGQYTSYVYADAEEYKAMGARLRRHMDDPQFQLTIQYQKKSMETFAGETSTFYLRNLEGEITGFIGLIRDVTDREQMEQELIEVQKMEALGQIAGGIAHDFNNVLGAISGAQQMLELQIQNDSVQRYLNMIKSSVERGKSVTNRMLTFTRSSKLDIIPVALGSFLEEFKEIARYTLPRYVGIQLKGIKNSHSVLADPAQLQQVLFTLSINAVDAMPEGGTIRCAVRRPTDRERRVFLSETSEPYWCLLVSDEGIGMDEDTIERIFEPFFTTKESSQGTGLGLAVAYKILQMHDGWIDVESTPGEGSTFIVGLPACKPEERVTVEKKSMMPGEGETVLIVDDEESIRHMLDEALSGSGYTAIQAETGQQALDVLSDSPKSVDLVITDIGLPDMNGKELIRAIQERFPDIPILAMTGYVDPVLDETLTTIGAAAVFKKPYDTYELSRKIRELLTSD